MTYDDGLLTVYTVTNSAQAGKKPVCALTVKGRHYYSIDSLGYNRFYTAMQAKEQISALVSIPGHEDVDFDDIVILDDGIKQYKVSLVQKLWDNDGIKTTKLTLSRLEENYAVSNNATC